MKHIWNDVIEALESNGLDLYGMADLRHVTGAPLHNGQPFPRAISFAASMNPGIMTSIKHGPNRAYAQEYARVNHRINAFTSVLVDLIQNQGNHALGLPASKRTDPVHIKGDFPHKTAATLAGLGWIGRNCQLVTRKHGPWIRLGTVFTDLPAAGGRAVTKSYCGTCTACVEACPAGALAGNRWFPGIPREKLLDVLCCDTWKKQHYYEFHQGHNCGICAAVCPFGK